MHDGKLSLAKYIPLVLVALLFLVFLFLPYTLLLLLGQWIQPKSHLCLLTWVRNPKLKAILDAYHAPYKLKHRYWTGLLLSLRCALFLVFAFNISGDSSVNLLIISSTTSGIFVGFALLGNVYKTWYLNAFELSIHSQPWYTCCYYLPCDPFWWKSGCWCIHLSWYSILHLYRDHQLPHLHTNQIETTVHTARSYSKETSGTAVETMTTLETYAIRPGLLQSLHVLILTCYIKDTNWQ